MPQVKTASDLYGLPLDEFTAQRNELAKRLKGEGEAEEAARVAKLRKPSTAAWAVNQLVRTQAKDINALFEAGDSVAESQARGQADRLREAAGEQRAQLAGLMSRAQGLLDSEGRALAPNVLERVGETLRAAAIDPECRAQVKDGCLTRELQFTGLGGLAGAPARSRGADAAAIKQAKQREQQAKQDLREAEKALRKADRELEAAQTSRDAAAETVERAEAALAEASEKLDQLQRGGR
jgi:hypothetical protein